MKRTTKPLAVLLTAVILLTALPHAAAATAVNTDILSKLTELKALCRELQSGGYLLTEGDRQNLILAEETAQQALDNPTQTDEEAVSAVAAVGNLLCGMDASSTYGLTISVGDYADTRLFFGRFLERYPNAECDEYKELFYHYQNGAMDWALASARNVCGVTDDYYAVLGSRVVRAHYRYAPFELPLAIYDVRQNCFYSIDEAWYRYDGVEEALDHFNIGRRIGDLDGDNRLSVKDVTELQRCLADISDFPEYDALPPNVLGEEALSFLSDLNRDGRRDVGDVTALQRQLAEFGV